MEPLGIGVYGSGFRSFVVPGCLCDYPIPKREPLLFLGYWESYKDMYAATSWLLKALRASSMKSQHEIEIGIATHSTVDGQNPALPIISNIP